MDWMVWGLIPGRGKILFSTPHPASYPVGFRGCFPGDKTAAVVKLTIHLVKWWSYTSNLQYVFMTFP
jgi:hypothetical protein